MNGGLLGGFFLAGLYPFNLLEMPEHVVDIKLERVAQPNFNPFRDGNTCLHTVQTYFPRSIE